LEASRDDLITWREQNVTKAFLAYLEDFQRQYADASCEESFKGNHVQASAHAGASRVLKDLVGMICRDVPFPDTTAPDDYQDPAARRL